MRAEAKKISIAFFILFASIIGMVIMTAVMLVSGSDEVKKGFARNDSLHELATREHAQFLKNQNIIIANQDSIIRNQEAIYYQKYRDVK